MVLVLTVEPLRAQTVDYTKYHTYDELTSALQGLVRSHSNIATLVSIGETRGGRSIWAVEIANRAGVPVEERPALLMAANLEGDHLIGSELALATIDWLLTQYGTNDEVRQRIDEQAFFVVPRVNPDGAEAMFGPVATWQRGNLSPYDDDNDARVDEDPPEDLNGDGLITFMRVRDPSGPYMTDPADARLLKRADASKAESGAWALYWEGRDNDVDGFYNEDGVGGVDLNRNFQHEYPYYTKDAGRHMVSEAESIALMEYAIRRRGVAAILTFGASDNLISSPGGRGELAAAAALSMFDHAEASTSGARAVGVMSTATGGFGRGGRGGRGGAPAGGGRGGGGQQPATMIDATDLEYFRTIAEKYQELTGIRRAAVTRAPRGAFFEYGYYQFGVPSFSTPGWGIEMAAADTAQGGRAGGGGQRGGGAGGSPAATDNDKRLVDWFESENIDGFVDWTPFDHPQLGEVEIGGFRPYATSNPPAEQIDEFIAGHAQFALYLSSLFPRVRIASTTVTDHGGGVFRIEAEIENTGYLPTAAAQGVRAGAVQPVMVQLGVDPETIITGDVKTNFISALAGSATRRSFQWVIRGQPGARIELKLRSQKSGSGSMMLTLR
jgi:murein tripeptide amidase MpaA